MITILTFSVCIGALYGAYKYMTEVERDKQKRDYFKSLPPDDEFLNID